MSSKAALNWEYRRFIVLELEDEAIPTTAKGNRDGRRSEKEYWKADGGWVGKFKCKWPVDRGLGMNRAEQPIAWDQLRTVVIPHVKQFTSFSLSVCRNVAEPYGLKTAYFSSISLERCLGNWANWKEEYLNMGQRSKGVVIHSPYKTLCPNHGGP